MCPCQRCITCCTAFGWCGCFEKGAILADAYSGIDIFAGHAYEGATRFSENVRWTVERSQHEAKDAKSPTVREDSGVKFSIQTTKNMTIEEQIKMFNNGHMKSSDAFYFGITPDVCKKMGFERRPLIMTIREYRKSTKEKHHVVRRNITHLMENLNEPILAFGTDGNAGFLLDDYDGDGKMLLAAIHDDTIVDREKVNNLVSLYGIEHPREWIRNQMKKNCTVFDTKKANDFLQRYGYKASRE